MAKRVNRLPANPRKGQLYEKVDNGRITTYKATGRNGQFGMWTIVGNRLA